VIIFLESPKLIAQWQRELKEKFDETFVEVNW
jgi:hypothetical protein